MSNTFSGTYPLRLLVGKRQYLISGGHLHGQFETTLPVGDDVLQGTLASGPDHRMRSIVATIQHEQNQAIRMPLQGNLLVEGPAGSGKTSVALQRVAYVLYRERKHLTSRNVLFLSPSRLFADYISQVLPELGEENPILWSFEDLMAHLFAGERFQSRFDSLEATWSTLAGADSARLGYKASEQFTADLERFLTRLGTVGLPFRPLGPAEAPWIRPETLHRWFTRDLADRPVHARLDEMAERLAPVVRSGLEAYRDCVGEEIQQFATSQAELSEMVEARVTALDGEIQTRVAELGYVDWREVYRNFYRDETSARLPNSVWQAIRQETLAGLAGGEVPYEDQPGMLWLRASLAAERTLPDVRMLVMDEAQDYTPCQYGALARTFRHARLTAVGDVRQVLNPGYGLTRLDGALKAFTRPGHRNVAASAIRLRTTYRSSPAIMTFARQLLPEDADIEVAGLGRGDEAPPTLVAVQGTKEWGRVAARLVDQARTEDCTRIGIITRTVREARRMAGAITAVVTDTVLLDSPEARFVSGVVVLPLTLAKGLEFDAVVIADVSASAYGGDHERLLLYTAVTRAVRRLWLIALGPVASWMPPIVTEVGVRRSTS
ncbi:MAG: HelD family protein [Clostridia bacterium]